MLYLIKEYGKEKEYLKIGKADNIKNRIRQYNTNCAEFEILDTFEGNVPEESLLHSLLKKYLIKGEWMEYNKEIILLWKLYKEIRPKLHECIILYEGYIKKSELDKYKSLLDEKDNIINRLIKLYEEKVNLLEQENKELRKKLNFENEITIC